MGKDKKKVQGKVLERFWRELEKVGRMLRKRIGKGREKDWERLGKVKE